MTRTVLPKISIFFWLVQKRNAKLLSSMLIVIRGANCRRGVNRCRHLVVKKAAPEERLCGPTWAAIL